MIFWIILMQDWTEGKWEGFYNKSLQIAVVLLKWTWLCRDTTGVNCNSLVILQGSTGFHRGSAGIHQGSAGIHRGSTIALLAI
jgi:hypothetical protein